MIIAGIDYSLRCPAVCVFDGDTWSWDNLCFYYLTEKSTKTGVFMKCINGERLEDWNQDMERYCSIADWTSEIVLGCDEVALEGYSMGSRGKVFNIAENTGVLKYKLFEYGIPLSVYPPTTVKKFATGKGNAKKEQMYDSFVKETKKQIMYALSPKAKKVGNPVSDIVDSYYICKMLFNEITERGAPK